MNHNNSDSSDQTASLARRTARGGLWVFSLRVVNKGLGIIRTIILARFLSPADFGLFGIAMLAPIAHGGAASAGAEALAGFPAADAGTTRGGACAAGGSLTAAHF